MSTAMVSSSYCELGYRTSVNYQRAASSLSQPSSASLRSFRPPLERKNAVCFPNSAVPVSGGSGPGSHVTGSHVSGSHVTGSHIRPLLLQPSSTTTNASCRPSLSSSSLSPPGHEVGKPPALHVGVSVSLSVNNVLPDCKVVEHRKLDRSISEPAEKVTVRTNQTNASRYKTELCRPFEESGSCKYGDKCQFAHGMHELRNLTRHPKYKTELCRTFHTTGFCPYGPRCHFIHNSEETKKTVMNSLQSGFPAQPVRTARLISRTTAPDLMFLTSGDGNCHNSGNNSNSGLNGESRASVLELKGKSVVSATAQLMRPKAMSVGSFSIGSSGDLTPPSSPSGSPTSMGSFFTEEPFSPFSLTTNAVSGSAASNLFASFVPHFTGLFSPSVGPNGQHYPMQQLSRRVSDSDARSSAGVTGGHVRGTQTRTLRVDSSNQQRVMMMRVEPMNQQSSSVSLGQQGSGVRSGGPGFRTSASSYPGPASSPVDSLDSDLEHLGLGGSSPDSCCGSPLDAHNQAVVPRLPTFARFANNNTSRSLESE